MFALSVNNCSKIYENGFKALDQVSLAVNEGEFFGLLGPNGAGKTSLISIIASLIMPTSGDISIFGHDLVKARYLAKDCLGLVPQEFNMNWHLKVRQIVENHAGYFGVPKKTARIRSEYYLKMLGLWDKREQNARSLSGGMKRRLMIARAMMHEPKLILLDEPTAGVDVELRHATWSCLQELNAKGVTIILTTHNLEEAEYLCKQIAIIDKGSIIRQGNMSDMLKMLQSEKFMVEFLGDCPSEINLGSFSGRRVTDDTVEFVCKDKTPLSELFAGMQANNLQIIRIWKKSSRLEEMFLELIEQQGAKDEK